MKTDPTGLDREAATLFRPAPRMFAWTDLIRPPEPLFCGTVLSVDAEGFARVIANNGSIHSRGRVLAFDMDDPATQGAALAQVEEARDMPVKVDFGFSERQRWVIEWACKSHGHAFGVPAPDRWHPTRGAALVAAMRAVKEKTRATSESFCSQRPTPL